MGKWMSREDLKIFMGAALRENPEVFPSSPQIRKLLAEYGVRAGRWRIREVADIQKMKSEWIRNCDERKLLERINKRGFFNVNRGGRKLITEKLSGICARLCSEAGAFPASNTIAELIKVRYGIGMSDNTVMRNTKLATMQLDWIAKADDADFIKALSEGRFSRDIGKKVKACANERVKRMITEIALKSDIFPSKTYAARLVKEAYGGSLNKSTIDHRGDIRSLQLAWLEKCSDNEFLRSMKKLRMRYACEEVNAEVYARKRLIEERRAMEADYARFVRKNGKGKTEMPPRKPIPLRSSRMTGR
ncbi:hypothetical protein H0O02_01815 [Candidatus Micrarchaeota archaeon]|nr:hypothetical protein [Candidatus Micrarchaeota archaeon]